MLRLSSLTFLCFLAIGCSETASVEESAKPESELYAMPLEARRDRYESRNNDEVHYENPNTGYSTDYTLDVEYNSDGSVERINFPNGGWNDHFVDEVDNHDGTVTVTDDRGHQYTVPAGDRTENEGGPQDRDDGIEGESTDE